MEIWKEEEKTSLEWYEASVRYWQWEAAIFGRIFFPSPFSRESRAEQKTVRNSYEEMYEASHIAHSHYILFKGLEPNVNSNYLFIWA